MATQVIERRSPSFVAIVAVALMLAVIVLLVQANAIWSNDTVSPGGPAAQVGNSEDVVRTGHLLPPNCHVKYGCTVTAAHP